MSSSLERNARLYPVYAGLLNAHFWLPVFFLYFNARFALDDVLRLEAIYYAAIVTLEVPSGYFSDRFGRRLTLIVANVALTCAYAVFFLSTTYAAFVVAQIALATGLAFNSGTDTSIHYESLLGIGKADQFDAREARVARNTFLAAALAAIAGGTAGSIDLRFAYALSVLFAVFSLGIVLRMTEPCPSTKDDMSSSSDFLRQVAFCLRLLRNSALLWLVLYSVLMIVLNHVPYEFYQPYIALQGGALDVPSSSVPAVSGVMTALPMLIGSAVASSSIRLRNRLGLVSTLLTATGLQVLIIASMGLVFHPVVFGLILLRTCPRALMTAPLNAAIAPRVPRELRATFFSLQSFLGRLSFSALLLLLAALVGEHENGPSAISESLRLCAGIGLTGLVVLAVSSRTVNKGSSASDESRAH